MYYTVLYCILLLCIVYIMDDQYWPVGIYGVKQIESNDTTMVKLLCLMFLSSMLIIMVISQNQ